ncbi:leucine rich repeat family protein [Stylonychia lemnae]|uniref:Leucine rich repeat family protein n=1 Tax=Stylonychia lemnae TaxID=5949 RepID=A0A077ZTX3_STYLE|nr:leucine rich repeat family protein [Stylonychia lemnae]|eukprot:CDW73343.1 leucine rich repeat family protein [Stylonychia lemnae]
MSSTQCSTHNDSMDGDSSHGGRQLTQKFLKELFKKEWKMYYRTPELNEKLYLHYKGVTKIEGLQDNVKLRSLYLQENLIEKMEGLDTLTDLCQLNLSDNIIQKVEGLAALTKLETIQLKRNRIGKGLNSVNSQQPQIMSEDEAGQPISTCIGDLEGLLECPSLTVLDISDNYIEDPAILPEILEKLPNLAVLYLQGNPVVKKIRNYRKTLIARIPTLKYLDDRPVFDEDRRYAEAFARGGLDEERKERDILKQEKEDAHWKNHEAFREMIRKAREEKKQAEDEAKKKVEEEILKQDNEKAQPNQEEQIQPEESNEELNQSIQKAPSPEKFAQEESQPESNNIEQDNNANNDEDEEPPELEQVDLELERLRELEQTKEQKQKEWLKQVTYQNAQDSKELDKPFIPWDDSCDLPKPDLDAIQKRVELLKEQQVHEETPLIEQQQRQDEVGVELEVEAEAEERSQDLIVGEEDDNDNEKLDYTDLDELD